MAEFVEIIEWTDQNEDEIVHRFPEVGSAAIKFGAQLIVRENQAAVFFNEGKGMDVFGPGRHTLSTRNLPIITRLLALPYGFKSPFRAEVYFVNQRVFTKLRWGTKDPVAFRDSELGLVRLRAFGAFTIQIREPLLFLNTLVGRQQSFETSHVEDYLREVIVSRLNDFLGEKVDTLSDLPRHYDEMAEKVKARLTADFEKYGVALVDLFINRITPPEDVQKMIDERSGMSAVGDLNQYLKFKAAKSLTDSAGGIGSTAIGAALGGSVGMMLPGMIFNSVGGREQKELASKPGMACTACHGEVDETSRFCSHCGHQVVVIRKCSKCSRNLSTDARYCSSCGTDQTSSTNCPKCATSLPPSTQFCFNCGERTNEASVL